jgi:hypothetical protein
MLRPGIKVLFGIILSVAYFFVLAQFLHNSTKPTPSFMGHWAHLVPGWSQPVIAVGGVGLLVAAWASAVAAAPWISLRNKQVSAALEQWRSEHPNTHYKWHNVTPARAPKKHRIREAFQTRSAGAPVIALDTSVKGSGTTGGMTLTYHMIVSTEFPAGVKLTVFGLRGYRNTAPYRALAFWRFHTGNREFDAKFFVLAGNRARAREVLGESLMGWLVGDGRAKYLPWNVDDGVLSIDLNGQFDPAAREPLAEFVVSVAQRAATPR